MNLRYALLSEFCLLVAIVGCSTPTVAIDGNLNDNGSGTNVNANVDSNTNDNSDDYVIFNYDQTQPTCDGVSGLAVLLPKGLTMSLYQGSLHITPTVCGGEPPYTYRWTPAENLQSGAAGPGGAPGTSVTSPDVDFRATAVGEYIVSVTIGDGTIEAGAAGAPSATMRVGVDDYPPLTVDAGEDVAVPLGESLELACSATGGTGLYNYSWSPGGAGQRVAVDTDATGEVIYTVTVTDQRSGEVVTDSVRVVVLPEPADCSVDHQLPTGSANFVAFDSAYGPAGQAVIVSQSEVYFFDFSDESFRAETLRLPADGRGIAIDTARRRAFVTTQLEGEFTRSVQVIDLDAPALASNIGLTTAVVQARGMAVVPSTGHVIVAVSSGGDADGLMMLNPATATLLGALQNIHHPSSFAEPIDVAVLEQGGLDVAVVANAKSHVLTLVPLSRVARTPNESGTTGEPLQQVEIGGIARAIAANESQSSVIVGWNNGQLGRTQVVAFENNEQALAGRSIYLPAAIVDQGIEVGSASGMAYAALGDAGAVAINLEFKIMAKLWTLPTGNAWAVAAQTAHGAALIVGSGVMLSERCP